MNEKVKQAITEFRKANGIPNGNKYKGQTLESIKSAADKIIPITLTEAKSFGFAPSLQCNGFFDCVQNGEKVFYEWVI